MPHTTLDHPTEAGRSSFRKATVEDVTETGASARVRLDDDPPVVLDARLALSGASPPGPGDRVLVARSPEQSFVIAVLERTASDGRTSDLRLRDGTTVRVAGEGSDERVQLLSPRQELLVEYDPAAGRLRLDATGGDLELAADGDIVLDAGRAVRLAGESVEADGEHGVRLGTPRRAGQEGSSVSLDRRSVRLTSTAIGVTSRSAKLNLERTDFAGAELRARVGTLRLVARRIERVAERIHETADRIYRTVRKTLQLRAERMRSVVRSTFHLKARKAFMKSDEDFKLKGDQIHLG